METYPPSMEIPLKTEAVIVKDALSGRAPVSIHMLLNSEINFLSLVNLGSISSATHKLKHLKQRLYHEKTKSIHYTHQLEMPLP